jgi:hypothetical protein
MQRVPIRFRRNVHKAGAIPVANRHFVDVNVLVPVVLHVVAQLFGIIRHGFDGNYVALGADQAGFQHRVVADVPSDVDRVHAGFQDFR